jgi:hypothetical protein
MANQFKAIQSYFKENGFPEGGYSTFTDETGNQVVVCNGYTREQFDQIVADYNAAHSYAQNRAAAYPSLQEQLDMQYWDSVNGTTTWADAIAAVKAANPKPE